MCSRGPGVRERHRRLHLRHLRVPQDDRRSARSARSPYRQHNGQSHSRRLSVSLCLNPSGPSSPRSSNSNCFFQCSYPSLTNPANSSGSTAAFSLRAQSAASVRGPERPRPPGQLLSASDCNYYSLLRLPLLLQLRIQPQLFVQVVFVKATGHSVAGAFLALLFNTVFLPELPRLLLLPLRLLLQLFKVDHPGNNCLTSTTTSTGGQSACSRGGVTTLLLARTLLLRPQSPLTTPQPGQQQRRFSCGLLRSARNGSSSGSSSTKSRTNYIKLTSCDNCEVHDCLFCGIIFANSNCYQWSVIASKAIAVVSSRISVC